MNASTALTPKEALMVLNGLSRVGPVSLRRLLAAFGDDPVAVLAASESALRRIAGIGPEAVRIITAWPEHFDLVAEQRRLEDSGLAFVSLIDPAYPPLLREIYDSPTGLYFRGPLRPGDRCVAIVGTRHASLYGLEVARKFAMSLATRGWCVVSGLARGIDTAAHEGALAAGGPTAAVLGCGPDRVYPPENLPLFERIADSGCVISEFKFGTRASRTTFPMRNRVLAGMSRAIIVIETDVRGGSLITARFAGEQGRDVFAVPGRIDSKASRGCHQLIRDGATLLTSIDELFDELLRPAPAQPELALDTPDASDAPGRPTREKVPTPSAGQKTASEPADGGSADRGADDRAAHSTGADDDTWADGLTEDETAVMGCLRQNGPLPLDAMAEATDVAIPALSAVVVMLELKGRIAKRVDGTFAAR